MRCNLGSLAIGTYRPAISIYETELTMLRAVDRALHISIDIAGELAVDINLETVEDEIVNDLVCLISSVMSYG